MASTVGHRFWRLSFHACCLWHENPCCMWFIRKNGFSGT